MAHQVKLNDSANQNCLAPVASFRPVGQPEENCTYMAFIFNTPLGGRAEVETKFTHYAEGDEHSHWYPEGLIKLNGHPIDFDDFLAEFSGVNDAELGNIKLDSILDEYISMEWQRWFDQKQIWDAEDAQDAEDAETEFRIAKGF